MGRFERDDIQAVSFMAFHTILKTSKDYYDALGWARRLSANLTETLNAGLGGVHLVVGHDVLEDGLAGGSLLVLQPLDGSGDHAGVGGVGSGLGGLLGLGGLGSGGHGFDLLAGRTILPM